MDYLIKDFGKYIDVFIYPDGSYFEMSASGELAHLSSAGSCDFELDFCRSFNSLKRTRSLIYDISRSNEWDFFGTFTFDPKKIDRFDFKACYKAFSSTFKNFPVKYLAIPEKHENGAFHIHALLQIPNWLVDNDGHCLFWDYGFSFLKPVFSSVGIGAYLAKYVTKDNVLIHQKNGQSFWVSKGLNRPAQKWLTGVSYMCYSGLGERLYYKKKGDVTILTFAKDNFNE